MHSVMLGILAAVPEAVLAVRYNKTKETGHSWETAKRIKRW
jgi:hypothetical protein